MWGPLKNSVKKGFSGRQRRRRSNNLFTASSCFVSKASSLSSSSSSYSSLAPKYPPDYSLRHGGIPSETRECSHSLRFSHVSDFTLISSHFPSLHFRFLLVFVAQTQLFFCLTAQLWFELNLVGPLKSPRLEYVIPTGLWKLAQQLLAMWHPSMTSPLPQQPIRDDYSCLHQQRN